MLERLKRALKKDGIMYVSFKYGDFEGYRGDRYYTDLNEDKMNELFSEVVGLTIIETSITASAIKERDEKWLNILLEVSKDHQNTFYLVR